MHEVLQDRIDVFSQKRKEKTFMSLCFIYTTDEYNGMPERRLTVITRRNFTWHVQDSSKIMRNKPSKELWMPCKVRI